MAVTQYIGARYVPLVMGEYDPTLAYDPLSIVIYNNNSYTSKIPVPAGVTPENSTYWLLTGNFNAQLAALSETVNNLKETAYRKFNTVLDMVADQTISIGELLTTAGYESVNDGGGAVYYARLATESDQYSEITDGSTSAAGLIRLSSPYDGGVMVAELLQQDVINVRQFGAVHDGETDDSSVFERCVAYALNRVTDPYPVWLYRYGGGAVYMPSGYYRLHNIVIPSHVSVIGEDSSSTIIINDTADPVFYIWGRGAMENICFIGNTTANIIDTRDSDTEVVRDYYFNNLIFRAPACSASIAIIQGWNNKFQNVSIYGGAVGIYVSMKGTDRPNNYDFKFVQVSNTNAAGIYMESAIVARFENCDMEAVGQNNMTHFNSSFMPAIKGVTVSIPVPYGIHVGDIGRGLAFDNCWFERTLSSVDDKDAIAVHLPGPGINSNAIFNNCNFWTDNTVFFYIGENYLIEFNGGHYNLNTSYNSIGTLPTTTPPIINNSAALLDFCRTHNVPMINTREWAAVTRQNLNVSTQVSASSGISVTTAQITKVGKINIMRLEFNCTEAKSAGATFASFTGIPTLSANMIRAPFIGFHAGTGSTFALAPYGVEGAALALQVSSPIAVNNYYNITIIYMND